MLALVLASGAQARSFDIEDLVRQEALGEAVLTPDEHWLVFARRGAAAGGQRFDLGPFNPDLRTTLLAVDLTAPGAPRPLFRHEPEFGYRVGPLSPQGRRLAVWRISGAGLELGVTVVGSGEVRWLGVSAEAPTLGTTVAWLSEDELIAIATAETPYELFAPQASQRRLPSLWAATARGEAAVTALGSGRFQGLRPAAPPKSLVRISARTGEVRELARGEFTDLELSPSGRWLAVLEAGPEIPLSAARPPQGPYGIATREKRLRLLHLASGRLVAPCSRCDLIGTLLSWSADDRLLVYVRGPGEAWSLGRLAVVAPAAGALKALATDVRPLVDGRPERVFAGWWGREPLVLGRRPGDARDEWFRLADGPATPLTAALRSVPRTGVVVTPAGPLIAADGAAWRLARDGRPRRIAGPFRPEPSRADGVPNRLATAVRQGGWLLGRLSDKAGARLARVSTAGPEPGPPASDETLAAGRTGALLLLEAGGGRQHLVWRKTSGCADQVISRLNDHLAEVDRPVAHPVPHAGPHGEPLTSWLFLPRIPLRAPPPLVVVPYPGQSHPAAPATWDGDAMTPTAVLLGRGYAVLVPSLPAVQGPAGPAERLGARLLDIVDAAAARPELAGRFDPARPALWGHSFGAWGSLMAASQSERFSAVVATAARTHLASAYGQFTPWRRLRPDEGLSTPWSAGWTESLQADMRAPPWAAAERYQANSPLFQVGRIRTPVMLVAGELDGSHLAQAEEMFSALYRQGKDAILVTYWGEGHALASPGNLRDLYGRGLAFLDLHLRAAVTPAADAAGDRGPGSASAGPTPPGRRR
jgi:dipeptidyl aminopeptidase/acylaminoacyl peptidase